ncbi:MAG: MerR family transcriptional regulator [bacterium]
MEKKAVFIKLGEFCEITGIPEEKIEEYQDNFGELLNLKRDSRGNCRYTTEDAEKFRRIHNMAVKGLSSRAIIRLFQVEPEQKAGAPSPAKAASDGLRAALVENLLSRVSDRITDRLSDFSKNFETRQTDAVRRLAGIMETQVQIFSNLKNLQAAIEKKPVRPTTASTVEPDAFRLFEERINTLESGHEEAIGKISALVSESREQILSALKKNREELEKKLRSRVENSSLNRSDATRQMEEKLALMESERQDMEDRISTLIDEKTELERVKERLEDLLEETDREKSRKKSGSSKEDASNESQKNGEDYRKVYEENLLLRKAIEERDRAIAERDLIIDEFASQEW